MKLHIVVYGDTLSGIAKHYGFNHWREIYDHPSNAEFRDQRPDPNRIYPNDEIWIPIDGPPGPDPSKNKVLHVKVENIDQVVGLQRRLNHCGFDAGLEDNIYGPKTAGGGEAIPGVLQKRSHEREPGCDRCRPDRWDPGPEDESGAGVLLWGLGCKRSVPGRGGLPVEPGGVPWGPCRLTRPLSD